VGDWVSLLYGPRRVLAQIVEDRGLLGMNGRRLYRVRLDPEQGEIPTAFEVPEEGLEPAEEPGGVNPLLKAALEYLGRGKRFVRISPEKFAQSERRVTFYFSDGTDEERTFECDHTTFTNWWKQTSDYLRGLADAFTGSAGD
jgi:hypothetical protein